MDEIVPEESLYALDDDLAEAQQTVNDMTAAGKSDKDCRKLVEETRKEVQTTVDSCQNIMDSLPKGDSCPEQGQDGVKKATEAKSKADKHLAHTITEVTKASSTKVEFGSRTFSSLTEGKCESFYSSGAYVTAKASYTATVTAKTRAEGAAEEAKKALATAVAAAKKAKHECECKVKGNHEDMFSTHSASDAANQKAWSFACKVECVLDGKTACKCSAAPKCKRAKVTAAVDAAHCAAAADAKKKAEEEAKKNSKCPTGYKYCTKSPNYNHPDSLVNGKGISVVKQGQPFCDYQHDCTGDLNCQLGRNVACVKVPRGAAAAKCKYCATINNNHKYNGFCSNDKALVDKAYKCMRKFEGGRHAAAEFEDKKFIQMSHGDERFKSGFHKFIDSKPTCHTKFDACPAKW
jgi:hypothetical protein